MLATRNLLAQVVYVLRWTLFSTWLQKLFNLYIAIIVYGYIYYGNKNFILIVRFSWSASVLS